MKNSQPTLTQILPQIEKTLSKSTFQVSRIHQTSESASYAVQAKQSKKAYFQVISIEQNREDFAIVEIFVSNLSVTEKWSDIEISLDILPEYLLKMMQIAGGELSKSVTTDQKLEAIVSQIEEQEPKLAQLIKQLHNLEDHLEPKHLDAKTRKKFEAQLAKVETSCLKLEMEISKLAFRYFTNTIDPVDPFFANALLSADWSEKRASSQKTTAKKTAAKKLGASKSKK